MIRPRLVLSLLLLAALPAFATSDVVVIGDSTFTPARSPFEMQFGIVVANYGPDPSGPITLRITPPAPLRLDPPTSSQFVCAADGASLVCTHPGLEKDEGDQGRYRLFAPAIEAGKYEIVMEVETANDPKPENNRFVSRIELYHFFPLTSEADSGPGTLREGIERANAICHGNVTCRLEPAQYGGFSIRLESPLPAITACNLTIDAHSGSVFFGHRNIELDGSPLKSGNGFQIRSACPAGVGGVTIRGFSIGGFPENGIELATKDATPGTGPGKTCHQIYDNSIGLDYAALEPRPNGLRGVSVASPETCAFIYENYIGANRASGISVWATAGTYIQHNHIGWGEWSLPKPNGNGASGIFIGSENVFAAGNNIAFNGQFGVSIGSWVRRAGVATNVIHSNAGKAIDFALDGDTPNDADESDGAPNIPVITSARRVEVDTPTGKQQRTVVSGVLRSRKGVFGDRFFINLYFSGGPGLYGRIEALQPIAQFEVQPPDTDGPFEMFFESPPFSSLPGGVWLTAQLNIVTTGVSTATSELSAPVPLP